MFVLRKVVQTLSILEDLYYGELNPCERCSQLDDESRGLLKLKISNEQNLVVTLTEKQKNDFEKHKEFEQKLSQISEKKSFLAGFKLGVRIVIEVMN